MFKEIYLIMIKNIIFKKIIKKIIIKKLFFICFIFFCSRSIASAIETGLYISPKFIFSGLSLKVSNKNVNNLYVGAGASIGYNFYAINLYSPVRVEFEYLYRSGLERNIHSDATVKDMNMHTFLFGAYYDFYFCKVNYNPLVESKVYRNGKRYLMSVYLGILIGAAMEQYITETVVEKIGMVSIANYYNKSQFNIGFGLGFALNITTFVTVDVGYRFLIDTEVKMKNDFIAAMRLNF